MATVAAISKLIRDVLRQHQLKHRRGVKSSVLRDYDIAAELPDNGYKNRIWPRPEIDISSVS